MPFASLLQVGSRAHLCARGSCFVDEAHGRHKCQSRSPSKGRGSGVDGTSSKGRRGDLISAQGSSVLRLGQSALRAGAGNTLSARLEVRFILKQCARLYVALFSVNIELGLHIPDFTFVGLTVTVFSSRSWKQYPRAAPHPLLGVLVCGGGGLSVCTFLVHFT